MLLGDKAAMLPLGDVIESFAGRVVALIVNESKIVSMIHTSTLAFAHGEESWG